MPREAEVEGGNMNFHPQEKCRYIVCLVMNLYNKQSSAFLSFHTKLDFFFVNQAFI